MARARRRLRTSPATCRSSSTITDLAFASVVVALWSASRRWLRTFRWQRASASVALARLREPFCLRVTARERWRRVRRFRRNALGVWIDVPSEQTAKVWMPRARPPTRPRKRGGVGPGQLDRQRAVPAVGLPPAGRRQDSPAPLRELAGWLLG